MRAHDRRRMGAGQTLALFAVLLPGLIAGVGLGVDGANLALSYRDAQSAADLAALAGARMLSADAPSSADYTNAKARAVAVASSNGFPNGSGVTVTATSPYDVNGDGDIDDGTSSPDERHHVQVVIDSSTQLYFLPIVGVASMDLNVRALAGSAWTATGGTLPAVWAGCTTCNDPPAILWGGSNANIIGGVHSNCRISMSGSNNQISGGTTTVCGYSNGGSGNTNTPSPTTTTSQPPPLNYTYDTFCAAGAPDVVRRQTGTLELKNWYQSPTSAKILRSGVYCVSGSSGLIKLDEGNVTGNVTLVTQGKIEISGSDFKLSAFHSTKVLAWAGGTGDSVIKLAGSNGQWTGIIMAPNGEIEVSGSSNTIDGGGSIMAHKVKFNGQYTTIDSNGLSTLGPSTLDSLRLYE